MLAGFRENKRFFLIVACGLFLSFSVNFFGTLSTDEFIGGGKDSESLVSNQIVCKGEIHHNQLIGPKSGRVAVVTAEQCTEDFLSAYTSQFGLQGKLYTFGYQIISNLTGMRPLMYIAFAHLATALVTAIVFAFFALWVRTRFTLLVASIFSFLVAISPMIVSNSHNLYWAEASMILPLLFVLYFYQHYPETQLRQKILFWVGLGCLLYIRYLSGYEYLTTLTIMPMAAIAYFLYLNKAKLGVYIRQFALVGGVSFVAFFGAITTHVAALTSSTGSVNTSIAIIRGSAQSRTLGIDLYLTAPYDRIAVLLPDHYKITDTYVSYESQKESGSKLWSILVAASNYMLLPIIHLPLELAPSFSTYLQSSTMFMIILSVLYAARKRLVNKRMLRKIEALFLAVAVGFSGYVSWLIFALPHAMVHAHINGILMYLPFALFGYVLIGIFFQASIARFGDVIRKDT